MSEAAGELLGDCPSEDIGAYLDAELTTDRAVALEAHLEACTICRDELNSQKLFLLELSRSLEQDTSFDLPNDFTKAIVTKAESTVTGLRKRSERLAAASIIGLLLVLAAAGFAGDWGRVTTEAARPLSTLGAIFDVTAGFVHSVVFAIGFVLRKAFPGSAGAFGVLLAVAAAVAIPGYVFFRRSRRETGDAG